jgi:spore maturation protein CgeB
MTGLRVAVVGGYEFNALCESLTRGFRDAGCQAEIMPYLNWYPNLYNSSRRGSALASRLARSLYRPHVEAILLRTIEAFQPKLIIFVKCDDLSKAFYTRLRRVCKAPIGSFHPDDPLNQTLWLKSGSVHRRALHQIAQCDISFFWSKEVMQRAVTSIGRDCRYLPFAADPAIHHFVPNSDNDTIRLGSDVCFVGNWDEERERWLTPIADLGLAIWGGSYWGTRCKDERLRNAWRGRPLYGDEMAKACLASKVNLNILRNQNKDACNMRTFEIPACGGFLLHERSAALGEMFRIGVECAEFGTPDELRKTILHYLSAPAERETIADNGHKRSTEHTYLDRATRILDAFKLNVPPTP